MVGFPIFAADAALSPPSCHNLPKHTKQNVGLDNSLITFKLTELNILPPPWRSQSFIMSSYYGNFKAKQSFGFVL